MNDINFVLLDIETRADKALIRHLETTLAGQAEDTASVDELAFAMFKDLLRNERHLDEYSDPMVPTTYQVPIVIGVGAVDENCRLVRTEVVPGNEREMVVEFWARAERFDGCFVTFAGRTFDFPVLELAAYRHRVAIPKHLHGDARSRYKHNRHLDLYDVLTGYGASKLRGGLGALSLLAGGPPKGDVSGADVQTLYDQGRIEDIRRYCLTDVLRTYRVFLNVQLMLGNLEADHYQTCVRWCESDFAGQGDG